MRQKDRENEDDDEEEDDIEGMGIDSELNKEIDEIQAKEMEFSNKAK